MEECKLYRCAKCSAVLEVVTSCDCPDECLKCCDEPLKPVKANTVDASKEKHVPVVSACGLSGVEVKIGSVPHPMTPEHYIMWVELIDLDRIGRVYLKPGDAPAVKFDRHCRPGMKIRAYCNLHGLWEAVIE